VSGGCGRPSTCRRVCKRDCSVHRRLVSFADRGCPE
jgi:hypothetical protein